MYNKYVSLEKIKEYDDNIDKDPYIPQMIKDNATIREVCRAGLYLVEQLEALQCPAEYVIRIQYTAGRCSFGREPWEVHQQFLESYKLNEMEFEPDPLNIN
jgi:hypothetical protein